jgi:hypothetical protein
MYESDTTQFLRELKDKNPEIEKDQKEGRALWWDRPQDQQLQSKNDESRVAQSAYVYQTKS